MRQNSGTVNIMAGIQRSTGRSVIWSDTRRGTHVEAKHGQRRSAAVGETRCDARVVPKSQDRDDGGDRAGSTSCGARILLIGMVEVAQKAGEPH